MIRFPRRWIATGIATALAVAVTHPSPASAAPSPDGPPGARPASAPWISALDATPAVVRLMTAQLAIDRVADRIQALSSTGTATSGLAGIVVDPGRGALTVYWHGRPARAVAREVAAAKRRGVSVTVATAPYTLDQLLRETRRLAAAGTMADGRRIVTVGPKPDGSGLSVGVRGDGRAMLDYRSDAGAVPGPRSTSPVPITVEAAPEPTAASRSADAPPYWGGALISNGGRACTSGFGVTGNRGPETYLLTAAHCGTGTWSTGAGERIGSSAPAVDRTHDAQLIRADSGSAVWHGDSIAGDDDRQYWKYLTGAATSHVGDLVCTSGAFSGAVCNIAVVATNRTFVLDGHPMAGMVQAEQVNGIPAAGNGDSGGPTFHPVRNNANDEARARGTITAYDGNAEVPCAGVPTSDTRACSWRFWYPDITLPLATLGVHITVD